jgi:8-oxo-dGTP diphosphatase
MPYTYEYPRPMVTVDILLLRIYEDTLQILLIERGCEPFKGKWALPGGYVGMEESPDSAAYQELKEETGLENIPLRQTGVYGDPGRDPRGHTITIVYCGAIALRQTADPVAGTDARNVRWFPADHLPELAFDHEKIITDCLNKLLKNSVLKFW